MIGMFMDNDSRPSHQMEGHVLPGGWTVEKRIDRKPTDTGSCFSTGYIVKNDDGRRGFLKALDYVGALFAADTAREMKKLTDTFVFEKDLCQRCKEAKMKRVVHAIDSGDVMLIPNNGITKVSYLIFDLAEGSIRQHLADAADFDIAFLLRSLHNVAVGLNQLHTAHMAHQDLKPSNVLVYQNDGGAKVGDLGRSWSRDLPAPHDNSLYAGDPGYAPPELYQRSCKRLETRKFPT